MLQSPQAQSILCTTSHEMTDAQKCNILDSLMPVMTTFFAEIAKGQGDRRKQSEEALDLKILMLEEAMVYVSESTQFDASSSESSAPVGNNNDEASSSSNNGADVQVLTDVGEQTDDEN